MSDHDQSVSRPIALGTIRKNAAEEIRLTVETFRGHEIINIRVWYRDAAGKYRPGKQGLAFRLEQLGEVLDALRKAMLQ
jgi:hypothetical protein